MARRRGLGRALPPTINKFMSISTISFPKNLFSPKFTNAREKNMRKGGQRPSQEQHGPAQEEWSRSSQVHQVCHPDSTTKELTCHPAGAECRSPLIVFLASAVARKCKRERKTSASDSSGGNASCPLGRKYTRLYANDFVGCHFIKHAYFLENQFRNLYAIFSNKNYEITMFLRCMYHSIPMSHFLFITKIIHFQGFK